MSMGFDTSCPKMRLNPASVNGLMNFPISLSLVFAAKLRRIPETAKFLPDNYSGGGLLAPLLAENTHDSSSF